MIFDKLFKKKTVEIPKPIYPALFEARILPDDTTVLIRNVKKDEQVNIEEGKLKNKKVLFVRNRVGGLLGVLPDPFVKYLFAMVDNLQIEATVEDAVEGYAPLVLNLVVHGMYKKKWDLCDPVPGENGKEYSYGLNGYGKYLRLPIGEIPCKLVFVDDTCTVKAAGKAIGTIDPDKTERLRVMLHKYNCTTTLNCKAYSYTLTPMMVLRF